EGAVVAPEKTPESRWRERAAWIAAAVALAVLLFVVVTHSSKQAPGEVVRLVINPPDQTILAGTAVTVQAPRFALSPDGRAIVFAAAPPGGEPTLWLRPLADLAARPLPGTENATDPFWSPDKPLGRVCFP